MSERRRLTAVEKFVLHVVQPALIRNHVIHAVVFGRRTCHASPAKKIIDPFAFVRYRKGPPPNRGGHFGRLVIRGAGDLHAIHDATAHAHRATRDICGHAVGTCGVHAACGRTMLCINPNSASSLIANNSLCWTRHLSASKRCNHARAYHFSGASLVMRWVVRQAEARTRRCFLECHSASLRQRAF